MEKILEYIKIAFFAIGAALGGFFGGFDGALITLLVFVCLDYFTGLLVGIANKNLSSEIGFRGICKKVLIFALVGVAHLIDVNVIGSGTVLRTATIFFYIANEGISITENAGNLGLPLPKKLKEILQQIKDDNDEPKAEISE